MICEHCGTMIGKGCEIKEHGTAWHIKCLAEFHTELGKNLHVERIDIEETNRQARARKRLYHEN